MRDRNTYDLDKVELASTAELQRFAAWLEAGGQEAVRRARAETEALQRKNQASAPAR